MVFFYIRIGIYTAVTAAVFQTLVSAVVQSPAPTAFFKENGVWEWAEFSVLAASGVILVFNARRKRDYVTVLLLVGLLAIVAAVRELDYLFEVLAFEGAYKFINGPILVLCAYLAWKHRKSLAEVLTNFSQTAPFYFFISGLLVAVYAEIIGQGEFWAAIMGDSYIRIIKRSSEEMAEFMSYLLILFGALETFFIEARATLNNRRMPS